MVIMWLNKIFYFLKGNILPKEYTLDILICAKCYKVCQKIVFPDKVVNKLTFLVTV